MTYRNTHAYTVLGYLYKFAPLLIFPILQQIIFKPHSLVEIFFDFWKNILLILLIAFGSFLKYRSIKYSFYKDKIFVKTGVLIQKETTIPVKNINSIHIVKQFFASFFGCYKVYINVPSKNNKQEIIRLNFSFEELEELKKFIENKAKSDIFYRASKWKIVLLSLFWSNPLTSFVLAAPFVHRFSKILGEELSQKIYSTVDITLTLVALGLPPFFASIAYVLLATFLIAFFIQFFRYFDFKVSTSKSLVAVRRGLIRVDEKLIKKEKIARLSVRQTLLMRLLKLCNAYVAMLSGFEAESEVPILVAAGLEKTKLCTKNFSHLEIFTKSDVQPKISTLKNFLLLPLASLVALSVLVYKSESEMWYSQAIILFLKLLILFAAWWAIFRLQAYKNSGLAFQNGVLNIRGFKKLTLFSEYIPASSLAHMEIRQNFMQKLSGRCSLRVLVLASAKKSFCCKHLALDDVENFVEKVKNHKNSYHKE